MVPAPQSIHGMQSDAQLVDCARRGDRDAFRILIERYERTALAVALGNLTDLHAAEDAVQAALLLAFRRLETLHDGRRFGPWLMQIVRRQVVEVVRGRQITVPIDHDVAESPQLGDSLDAVEDREHLLRLVARLPDHERLLVGMRHFDGHSVADVATLTGRPVGTVTKQLSRAYARLRAWMEE